MSEDINGNPFNHGKTTAIGRGKALSDAYSLVNSPYLKSKFSSSYMAKPDSNHCICDRSACSVLCRSCGMVFKGRARLRCGVHPTSIHLMDLEFCPNCKTSELREFGEPSDRTQ